MIDAEKKRCDAGPFPSGASPRMLQQHLSRVPGVILLTLGTANAGPAWERPSLFLASLDVTADLRQRCDFGTLWRGDIPVASISEHRKTNAEELNRR